MPDKAELETEARIDELTAKLDKIYGRAYDEMMEKCNDYFKAFEAQDEKQRALVDAEKLTEEDYQKWRKNKLLTGKRYKQMGQDVAEVMFHANSLAAQYVNGELPTVYAQNFNYIGGLAEAQVKGYSFDLVSASTVKHLSEKDETLLPYKYVDGRKDERWNTKLVNSEILQGILQGESIPQIAKRLKHVTEMNQASAVRNARTAVTGAQNVGRLDSMKKLDNDGIILKKEWIAARDTHTRQAHLELDRQKVDVNKPFKSILGDIMYPGDPEADPANVYNCRCAIVTVFLGVKGALKEQENVHFVAQGDNISESFVRRPDKFQYEIEDIMDMQGFNGTPLIVSQEEFDKAVKESNFIAQRTYSAPDQETLDAYRDELYNGKWYVDCSTGGAQYGQGMYCAADYDGKLTKGIQEEMRHYQRLGYDRNGAMSDEDLNFVEKDKEHRMNETLRRYKSGEISKEQGLTEYRRIKDMEAPEYLATYMKDSPIIGPRAYTETFTLTPDAKVVTYSDATKLFAQYREAHSYEAAKTNAVDSYISSLGLGSKSEELDYKNMLNLYNTATTQKQLNELKALRDKFGNPNLGEANTLISNMVKDSRKNIIGDIGAFASSLGYDAINAEGHGESGSYTVILNRTKCIFLGGQ